MAAEGFLKRWSRLKAQPEEAPLAEAEKPAAPSAPGTGPAGLSPALNQSEQAPPPPPTIADAAALTSDSDFSNFVGKNVDAAVRRLAMKKLFADPHFHGHDGLDIYMGDYTIPSPVSADMLAEMTHNKNIFARLDEVIEKVDALLLAPDAETPAAATIEPPSDTPEPVVPPPAPDQEVA
jgi:hypothetical protein